MTERMLSVGRTACKLKAEECNNRTACVRKVVEGVGNDGNRCRNNSGKQFSSEQYQVKNYSANTRKVAIGSSNLWIITVVAVFNEQLYK